MCKKLLNYLAQTYNLYFCMCKFQIFCKQCVIYGKYTTTKNKEKTIEFCEMGELRSVLKKLDF